MESTGGKWNNTGLGTVQEQTRNCLVFPWRRYEASSCDLARRPKSDGWVKRSIWTCRVRRPYFSRRKSPWKWINVEIKENLGPEGTYGGPRIQRRRAGRKGSLKGCFVNHVCIEVGMLAQFSWLLLRVPLDTILPISNSTHPATPSFPVFKQPTRYLSVPFLRMAGITVSSRTKLKNNHHCECSCSWTLHGLDLISVPKPFLCIHVRPFAWCNFS